MLKLQLSVDIGNFCVVALNRVDIPETLLTVNFLIKIIQQQKTIHCDKRKSVRKECMVTIKLDMNVCILLHKKATNRKKRDFSMESWNH